MSPDSKKSVYNQTIVQADPDDESDFFVDEDPRDGIAGDDAPGLGILIRTDYTDERAWLAFSERLEQAEQEFASSVDPPDDPDSMQQDELPTTSTSGVHNTTTDDDDDDDNDSTSSSPIITVVNWPPETRSLFTDISNLTALRLLTDVDIRKISPPAGAHRVKTLNRLVDLHGWQEIYRGKTLWIYDAKSNLDQCVRLVSHHPDFYGTATGDSWRARVTHICELQVNISAGAMTIDFGGLDRYDYEERQRNLQEADT